MVDFGRSILYRKHIKGESISQVEMNRDLTKSPGPIGETEFKYLLEMLTDKDKVEQDSDFLMKSY